MKRSAYIEGEVNGYPGLKTIEFNDGGYSQYGVSRNITEKEGHAIVKQGRSDYSYSADLASEKFAIVCCTFDSPMDYAEVTRRAASDPNLVPRYNSEYYDQIKRMQQPKDWYGGFRTLTDGYDMICAGWEDGAKRASVSLGNTQVPEIDGIESMRRNLIFSDYGETLNIDQAMAGNWDKAWQTCRRIRSGVSRVLSVAIPFGGNCNRSPEEMFWNGAQGMIITDILEDKGYRVQLYGVHYSRHENGGVVLELDIVNMKRSDEPLRMDSIAAVVAHAGVFRTAGFASIVAKPLQTNGGLGRCIEESTREGVGIAMKLGRLHPGTITLDGAYTKDKAVSNILKFFENMKKGIYNHEE